MLSVQFCSSCITVQKSVLVRGNVGAASGSVVLRGIVSGGKWASFLLLLGYAANAEMFGISAYQSSCTSHT